MRIAIALLTLLSCGPLWAQLPVEGQPLSAVAIDDGGNVGLQDDELVFEPWSTSAMSGRPAYLQHLAARAGVDELNKALDDAVEALGFTNDQLYSAAIVNKDDAIWGTGAFVNSQLKKNKQRYPDAVIVLDETGKARKHWQLEEDTAAVIVLNPAGEVVFFRQGGLSEAEIQQAVDIMKQLVES